MVVLALETVTPAGSLALWRDGQVMSMMGDPGVPHAVRLPAAIPEFLRSHGCGLDDVTRMAIVSGPGSFTGVRIGVACAQGFAVTRGWPLAPVPTLDALAEGWRHARATAGSHTVLACLDGMRGEVFTASYRWDNERMSPLGEPQVSPPGMDLASGLERPVAVVGSGAVRYETVWANAAAEVTDALEPLAASAARLAALPAWPVVGPHALRPVYVRRPDVELARERRVEPR
jgi:tRNA threonylcarbamoyladenosine biosynthesis protein TsaB